MSNLESLQLWEQNWSKTRQLTQWENEEPVLSWHCSPIHSPSEKESCSNTFPTMNQTCSARVVALKKEPHSNTSSIQVIFCTKYRKWGENLRGPKDEVLLSLQ